MNIRKLVDFLKQFYTGAIFVIICALGYGVMPIFAIYAYRGGVNVITLLFMRFSLAALFFFIYLFLKSIRIKLTLNNLLSLFILGGIFYTLQSMFYFTSVKYIPVSLAVLILFTYPVFVSVLTYFVDKIRLSKEIGISMAVSIGGMVLALGPSIGNVNVYGVMLAVGSAVIYSCYIVLGNRVVMKLPPLVVSAYVTLFTALCLLIVGLFSKSISFSFSAGAWFPILGIVFFSTIISIIAFFSGMERLGVLKTSIIGMLEPVFSTMFSVVLFHEKLSVIGVLGGALVLYGAGLIILKKSEPKSAETEIQS
jgi:drug/metabolite transporter (DMT)-like permease